MQNFIPAYMKGWTYVRMIFSEPKFFGCIDNEIFLLMVLRCALRASESSAVKTGIRCIMRLDELSFEIRLERRTTKGSSSGRIMRLVPAFILETHNQTNYDTASSVTVLLVQ